MNPPPTVEAALVMLAGCLLTISFYLLMRRNMLQLVFGLILLSNGANLLVFALGRVTRGRPPLLNGEQPLPPEAVANPLSQALILTSIVISFALLAFMLVLVYRAEKVFGTMDVDHVRLADAQGEPPTSGTHPEEPARRP